MTQADLPPVRSKWRAVWEFPLVALMVALLAMAVPGFAFGWSISQLPLEALPQWLRAPLVVVAAVSLTVVIYKLVVVRLGEEPRDDLPFDARALDAVRGTAAAAVLMSAIVGVAAILGSYRIVGWGGSTSFALLFFGAGIQAAIVEEILFRGILFRFLEAFGGSWFALAFSSALFGLGHLMNDNATLFSSVAIAIEAGLMLGGAYMLTRNLWLAIGLHFGWNMVQGFIWDVPVSGNAVDGLVESRISGPELISGGMFGLEASLVALAIATPLGVWFVIRAAREGRLVRPWWVRRKLANQTKL